MHLNSHRLVFLIDDLSKNHRVTILEWFELEGPERSSSSNPPGGWKWPGRPSTVPGCSGPPSYVALDTSRDEIFTTSLGNLLQCLAILIAKNLFWISNLNQPSFRVKPPLLVLSLQALVESPFPALL